MNWDIPNLVLTMQTIFKCKTLAYTVKTNEVIVYVYREIKYRKSLQIVLLPPLSTVKRNMLLIFNFGGSINSFFRGVVSGWRVERRRPGTILGGGVDATPEIFLVLCLIH